MTTNNNRNRKELAAEITSLIDFIEAQGAMDIPRHSIVEFVIAFGKKYDLHALLRYFAWAKDNHESDDNILETIMHDLSGIRQNPETFCPRTSGYCAKTEEN